MSRLVFLIFYAIIQEINSDLCVTSGCPTNPGVNINIGINGNPSGGSGTVNPQPTPAIVNPGGPKEKPIKDLDNLSKKVIAFDKLVALHCINNHNEAFESYGKAGYELEYKLDGFKQEDVDVKISHRVIYVKGLNQQQGALSDIRVLSDTLDVAQASWSLKGDCLKVLIPYKTKLDEKRRRICNNVISNKTMTVSPDDGDVTQLYRKN